jgi:hypothetical protein
MEKKKSDPSDKNSNEHENLSLSRVTSVWSDFGLRRGFDLLFVS